MNTPKVTIICNSYNHEKYINKALDSFIMQKVDFSFKILIHDDASTDNTLKIIKEYMKRYPKLIKTIFEKSNQYSKGIRGITAKKIMPIIKSRYIALCEGDDYWTDENKLQKQVDFLDKNPSHTICFHSAIIKFDNNMKQDQIMPSPQYPIAFTLENLLGDNYIPTSSILYRKINYSAISKKNFTPGDWYLNIYHASKGKIGFIDMPMSVYYRHSKGIWFESLKDSDKLYITQGTYILTMFFESLNLFSTKDKLRSIIELKIIDLLSKFVKIDKKFKTTLVEKSLIAHPIEIVKLYTRMVSKNQSFFISENLKLKERDKFLSKSLNKIHNSKCYKVWQVYCNIRKQILGK